MNYNQALFEGNKTAKLIFFPRFGCSILSALSLLLLIILFLYTIIKNKFQKRKVIYETSPLLTDDSTHEIKTSHWIIFFIAISEFLGCLAIIIFIPEGNLEEDSKQPGCKIQGFLSTFCEITTISFTSVLSYWILQLSKGTMSISEVQTGKIIWMLYGYLPGIVFSIAPFFIQFNDGKEKGNIYGLSGYWCWIRFKEGSKFEEMIHQNIYAIIFYIFTWLNLIFSIIAMISSISRFSEFAKKVEEQNEEGFLRIKFFCDFIFYFPLIRVIGWLIPTANRIYGLIEQHDNALLYVAHGISISLVGFLNSIVFFVFQFKPFIHKETVDPKETKSTDNEMDIDLYPDDD